MSPTLFVAEVPSPLGLISLVATDLGLSGLYFLGQKHWPQGSSTWLRDDGPRFDAARDWLRAYFGRNTMPPLPVLDLNTGTAFQRKTWQALTDIPLGETVSYTQIAEKISAPKSVRAVGGAIGRNPISLIIPCHRVIGSSGKLTGYAGGLERKRWLLAHEESLHEL